MVNECLPATFSVINMKHPLKQDVFLCLYIFPAAWKAIPHPFIKNGDGQNVDND
jgi:hypothetical protein